MYVKIRKYLPWFLTLCLMYIMLSFSSQSGDISGSLSGDITAFLYRMISGSVPDIASDGFMLGHFIVRKLAHVSEYCLLALLILWSLNNCEHIRSGKLVIAYAACLTFSIADEWLQTSVSGRSGRFEDVAVDMFGVITAILAYALWRRRKAKHAEVIKK